VLLAFLKERPSAAGLTLDIDCGTGNQVIVSGGQDLSTQMTVNARERHHCTCHAPVG